MCIWEKLFINVFGIRMVFHKAIDMWRDFYKGFYWPIKDMSFGKYVSSAYGFWYGINGLVLHKSVHVFVIDIAFKGNGFIHDFYMHQKTW